MSLKNPVLLLALLLLYTTAAGQSLDKYLKRFPQETGVLYFIKPLKLKEGKAVFEADFSCLKTKEGDDPVQLNFTLTTRAPVRYIPALQIVVEEELLLTMEPETRYIDKKGNKWSGRFAGELPPEVLLRVFAAGRKVSFVIRTDDEAAYLFAPNRKWEKAAEVLGETLAIEWSEKVGKGE